MVIRPLLVQHLLEEHPLIANMIFQKRKQMYQDLNNHQDSIQANILLKQTFLQYRMAHYKNKRALLAFFHLRIQ